MTGCARHTTAALLLAAKVDPAIVKDIMGHSDVVTTMGYQHSNQVLSLDALGKVAGMLELP